MASFKMMWLLATLLVASVYAHPDVTIHSIEVLPDDAEVDIEDDGIEVVDNLSNLSERAPEEKAVFAVKKVESGFARTTNVGITVQKGTAGTIHFRIRVKAVSVEKIAKKAKFFSKSLTKSQKKELRKLSRGYDGDFDVPWLKFLGIDLSKKSGKKDFLKKRSKTLQYDKLALQAKALLKEVVAQKIEVRGTLQARGVSFIPLTVFSFIKIARVHFEDNSKLLVISDHPGNTVAATQSGDTVVPSEGGIEILG